MKADSVAAVILAGGRASRFGGQDKGLIALRGRPLVRWTLDRLLHQVDEVVISANRHLEEYGRLGHKVIADTLPNHPGPLAGILAAGSATEREWVLTSPCDTPFLPGDLVTRLLAEAATSTLPLIRAADPGQVHYTLMLFRRSLLPDLAAYLAEGGRRVQAWQARHPSRDVVFPNPQAFLNINTTEDLRYAEQIADDSPSC